MILALALLLLSGQVESDCVRVARAGGCVRGGGRASAPSIPLCDVLQAGDKAGSWGCMYGDGTMSSGSVTSFTAFGTPTNTVENGAKVRVYTAGQFDQETSAAAFPASDFTVCSYLRTSTITNRQLSGFGTGIAAVGSVVLPFELQINGGIRTFTSDGVTQTGTGTSTTSPLPVTTGNWFLLCLAYTRVGGAANNVTELYANGTLVNTDSTARLLQALNSQWVTNGGTAGGGGTAGPLDTRGFFITYKRLTSTDITRIYGAMSK